MIAINITPEKRKPCKKCGLLLPLGAYPSHPRNTDGHGGTCTDCKSKYYKARYESKKPEISAKLAKYRKANAERRNTYQKEYGRDPMVAKRSAATLRQRRKDPLKALIYNSRTRLRMTFVSKGMVFPSKFYSRLGYNQTELHEHLHAFIGGVCSECGDGLTMENAEIDHIVPLLTAKKEADVWHLNKLSNLRMICMKCNRQRPHSARG